MFILRLPPAIHGTIFWPCPSPMGDPPGVVTCNMVAINLSQYTLPMFSPCFDKVLTHRSCSHHAKLCKKVGILLMHELCGLNWCFWNIRLVSTENCMIKASACSLFKYFFSYCLEYKFILYISPVIKHVVEQCYAGITWQCTLGLSAPSNSKRHWKFSISPILHRRASNTAAISGK